MKPMSILSSVFGKRPGQSIQQFGDECKALRASCPAETSGKITSFQDFITECASTINVVPDFS